MQVEFRSEDGRQHASFDFETRAWPGTVGEEIAEAFATLTGPLGSWKRLPTARNGWMVAGQIAEWLATSRPELPGLAGLTAADARMLALAIRGRLGERSVGALRTLLTATRQLGEPTREALERQRGGRETGSARQPYTDAEYRQITTMARGIARRARDRVRRHYRLVADYRAGQLDDLQERDPRRCLAAALDHYDRTGAHLLGPGGSQSGIARRAVAAAGGATMGSLLNLRASEAWACALLLAAQTGLNASMLAELPAPHLQTHGPGQPGTALLAVNKPRRGARSAMTVPLTALPDELRPRENDPRPSSVLNTSLTTAYGVFMLLLELTEPARRRLGSTRAFVFYANNRHVPGQMLTEGLPSASPAQRAGWVRPWLRGNPAEDGVLLGVGLDRLRKTHLHRHRRPVAHTPATLAGYLQRMRPVTEESFQIIREALDEQVEQALVRRAMSVDTTRSGAGEPGDDTVLGRCSDFEHSPLDSGRRCRQSFLTCLDCANARAFPEHLPAQLLVLDRLHERRPTMTAAAWALDYAGPAAALAEIVNEYEPAQRDLARGQVTDAQQQLVDGLFTGRLDPA